MDAELDFDLIINGGGLAGASLACALASSGFRIALIEAKELNNSDQSSFDSRVIALTYSAGAIFRNLNVWQGLKAGSTTPIRQIEVTNHRRRGRARLQASDVGYESLGWNVDARTLGEQLYRRLRELEGVMIFCPATLKEYEIRDDCVTASVESERDETVHQLTARILVVADGGGSSIRQQLKFDVRQMPYAQAALVCRVDTDKSNRFTAYEHFIESGPLALLPVGESGYSVVWTLEQGRLKHLLENSEEKFLEELQNEFGDRAGRFVAVTGTRKSYPLVLSKLKKFVRPRVVIVGNASHTVHPVAGQGFNLALRDVAALADVLETHDRRGWDIGSYDVLAHYERWRLRESNTVTWFTDSLIRTFANDYPLFSVFRNMGLDIVQTLPPLRRILLARTMGLHGRQSKLVVEG